MTKRHWGNYILASMQFRHWKAFFNIIRKAHYPFDFLARYLFDSGKYPTKIAICHKSDKIYIDAYTQHDILTINEIFFREDYYVPSKSKVIVDLGSNIGISILYFIHKSDIDCNIYAYEPVSENIKKLYKNLNGFENRFILSRHAIGDFEGIASFGIEKTGRYGGIGIELENTILVNVVNINKEICKILEKHKLIDVLKIDIESNEQAVLDAIDDVYLQKIRYIHIEFSGQLNIPVMYFTIQKRGTVYTLKNTLFTD
ncbi:MAG: FkbM family methyltransferase [Desulfovibrio sp.]|jgi:FkbM family methyltransferase|nr:FkbM family methyltransferase [Desulfovibrio sp.]